MAAPKTPPKPVVAFFDVDNTLLRGASLYYFGKGAFRHGYIGLGDILIFAWQQMRFTAVGENRQHLRSVRERALGLLSGHTVAEIQALAVEVVENDILPRIAPESLGWAREHQAQGHQVWLATATPFEVASVLAERLAFDGALGTRLEQVEGVYTGELDGNVLHGDRKVAAVRRAAEAAQAELVDCWGYSDSRNDIPLLNLVGNPVAVNPDRALLRYATAKGWPVRELSRYRRTREERRLARVRKLEGKDARKASRAAVRERRALAEAEAKRLEQVAAAEMRRLRKETAASARAIRQAARRAGQG